MQLTLTLIIVVITVLISLGAFNNPRMYEDLIFYPPAVSKRGQWYRFFSCGLIHADGIHLMFNMLALYSFGQMVEREFVMMLGTLGKPLFLTMYILALPVCLLPTYFKHRNDYSYRSLGASGAVSAVIFSGLLLSPGSGVGFFLIPGHIPGFIFGPLYIIISIYLAKRGRDNINHSAHIWGAVFGMLFTIIAGKIVADQDVLQGFVEGVRLYLR